VIIVIVIGGMFVAKKAKNIVEGFEENPARAAVELIARTNPDIEVVDSDDAAGTVTIRHKETGEEITVNYEDIKNKGLRFESDDGKVTIKADPDGGLEISGENGNVTITGDKESGAVEIKTKEGEVRYGKADADELPDWIPDFPGADPENVFLATTPEGISGNLTLSAGADLEQAIDLFEKICEDRGFTIENKTMMKQGGENHGMLSAVEEKTGRRLVVSGQEADDGSTLNVVFSESK